MEIKTCVNDYNPSNLLAGRFHLVTKSLVIEKGQILQAGSVLVEKRFDRYELIEKENLIPAALKGKVLSMFVLAEDVDAMENHVTVTAYQTGEFIKDSIIVGDDVDISKIEGTLRIHNIYLHNCKE